MFNIYFDDIRDPDGIEEFVECIDRAPLRERFGNNPSEWGEVIPNGMWIVPRRIWLCKILLLRCKGHINILSLDYDLLDEHRNGGTITDWLADMPEHWPKHLYLHTANPLGRQEMYDTMMEAKAQYSRPLEIHFGPHPGPSY